MNKRAKTILSLVALAAVVAVFVGVYLATRPETVAGEKHITVELVGKDSARTVELDTDEEYLGPALQSEGLIDGTQSDRAATACQLYVIPVEKSMLSGRKLDAWCVFEHGADAVSLPPDTPSLLPPG